MPRLKKLDPICPPQETSTKRLEKYCQTIKALLLTTTQAAKVLGCHPTVLRHSRISGELWNHEAPTFIRTGKRNCMYRMTDLEAFIDRFQGHVSSSTEETKPANYFPNGRK